MPKFYTKIAASEAINSKPTGNVSIPRMYNPDLVTHRSFNPEQGNGKAWGPSLADPTINWDTTVRTPDNIHNTAAVLLREEMTSKEWAEGSGVSFSVYDDRQFKFGVPFDMYVAQQGNTTNVAEINKTRAYYADENGDAVGGSLANEPYHVNGWQYVYYIVATTNLLATGDDTSTAYFFYDIYAGWVNCGIKSGDSLSGTEIDPIKVNTDDNYMSQQRGVNLLGLSLPADHTSQLMRYPNNNQPYYGTGYKGTDDTYNPDLEGAYRGLYRVSYGKIAMNFDSGANHEMNPSKSGQTFLTDVRFADFNANGRPSAVIACNNKYMLKFNITSYTPVENSVIGNSEPFESCPKTLSLSQWVKFSDLITDPEYNYTTPEIYKFQFNPTGTRMYALGANILVYPNENNIQDCLWRFDLTTPFDLSTINGTPAETNFLNDEDNGVWAAPNGNRISRLRSPTSSKFGCGSLEFNPQFLRDSNTGSITPRTATCLISFCNWRDTESGTGGTIWDAKSAIAQYDFSLQNSVANAVPTAEGGKYTGLNLIEDGQLIGLINFDFLNRSYSTTISSAGATSLVRNFNPSYRYVRSGREQDNNYNTARTNPPCFYEENIDGNFGLEGISEMVFATARRPIHSSFNSWTSTNNNRSRFEIMFEKRKLPANNYIDGFNNDTLINTIDPMPVSNNTNSTTGNLDNADTLFSAIEDKMTAPDGSDLIHGVDRQTHCMTFGNNGYYAFLLCMQDGPNTYDTWGIRRIELSEPYDISTRTRNNEQFRSLNGLGLGFMVNSSWTAVSTPLSMEFGQITNENATTPNEYGETLYIQCFGSDNRSSTASPPFFYNSNTDGLRRQYRGDRILAIRFTTLWDLNTAYYYGPANNSIWSWSFSRIFENASNNYISNITEDGSFPYYGTDSNNQRPAEGRLAANRLSYTNFQFFDNGYKLLMCIMVANTQFGKYGEDSYDEYWVQLHLDFPYDLYSYQESIGGAAKHDTLTWKKLAGKTTDPLNRKNFFEPVYGRGGWDPTTTDVDNNKYEASGTYGPLEEQITSYARFEDFCPSFIQLINNGRTLCKVTHKGLVTFTNKKGTDWINPTSTSGTADVKFTQQNRFGWTLSKQVKDRASLADKYRDHDQTLNFSRKSNLYLSKSSPGSSSYTADKGDESGPTTVNISQMLKIASRVGTDQYMFPTVVSENGRFITTCGRSFYTFPKWYHLLTQSEIDDNANRAYVRQLDLKKLVDT